MTRMGTIWDRTVLVLRGRGAMLSVIAGLLLFLPTVVNAGVRVFIDADSAGESAILGTLSVVVTIVSIWGGQAIIAATLDPAIDQASAIRIGLRRTPLAIAALAVLALGAVILLLPLVALIIAAGFDLASMMKGVAVAPPANVSPVIGLLLSVYMLALAVFLVWLSARLFVLNPVIVAERLGLGSFRRSFELTRGIAGRLVGVMILYVILLLVVGGAVAAVTGVVFRFILGAEHLGTALFLAAVANAVVATGLSTIAQVFVTQLYRAVTGMEAAEAFE